jgi:CBS domain-containing protein
VKTVKEMLQIKGCQVVSVSPDVSVLEALQMMKENDTDALLVVEGGKLVGIMTDSDYTHKVVLRGRSSKFIPVREIMAQRVITVSPTHSLEECVEIMTRFNIHHLPVIESGQIIGMMSLNNAVQEFIYNQKDRIQFLEELLLDA